MFGDRLLPDSPTQGKNAQKTNLSTIWIEFFDHASREKKLDLCAPCRDQFIVKISESAFVAGFRERYVEME